MRCTLLNSDLILYAENSLPDDRREDIESHLSECSECRDFYSLLKESLMIVKKDKEIPEMPFLYTRIMAGLESVEDKKTVLQKRLIPAFGFSFILLAGILGGIYLGRLYSIKYERFTNDLQEEVSYLNDISQESIETFFLTIDDDQND